MKRPTLLHRNAGFEIESLGLRARSLRKRRGEARKSSVELTFASQDHRSTERVRIAAPIARPHGSYVGGRKSARMTWHVCLGLVDETYLKMDGRWCYVYRAIDSTGALVDVLFSERRDMAVAKAFFRSAKTVIRHVSDDEARQHEENDDRSRPGPVERKAGEQDQPGMAQNDDQSCAKPYEV